MEKVKLSERAVPTFIINKEFTTHYWVYAVYDTSNKLKFVGQGKISKIMELNPIRSITGYNPEEEYKVYLLESCENYIQSLNRVSYYIKQSELNGSLPEFNLNWRVYKNDRSIYCYNNGKIYRTASDVVRELGVHQSALSKHLSKYPGYRKVKGYVFDYADKVTDETRTAYLRMLQRELDEEMLRGEQGCN